MESRPLRGDAAHRDDACDGAVAAALRGEIDKARLGAARDEIVLEERQRVWAWPPEPCLAAASAGQAGPRAPANIRTLSVVSRFLRCCFSDELREGPAVEKTPMESFFFLPVLVRMTIVSHKDV